MGTPVLATILFSLSYRIRVGPFPRARTTWARVAARPVLGGVIETERLLLRPLRMADVDAFVALHADPRVHHFVGAYSRDGEFMGRSGLQTPFRS